MNNALAWYTWLFVQIIIGYNLVVPLILFFLYKIRSKPPKKTSVTLVESDYAIIITAFEQVHLLTDAVHSVLALNYSNYLVYIVADNCDISGLSFNDERIVLLRPETILASNTRSHFYAIERFRRDHERLTIIDSDNLIHPDYLNQLNSYFEQGFQAVQGIRKAKNLNTMYACLDAARDIYYHFYDAKILFELGSSATLSGSGMAFTTSLYNDCLKQVDITGAGFDKVLQFKIVNRGLRIAFAENAIVYDEKTSIPNQLVQQRSRWINTWFRYFKYGFTLLWQGIKKPNLNQWLFGFILLRPPLFIFLILSLMCLSVNLLSGSSGVIWTMAILCFVVAFLIPLFRTDTDKRIYRSLIHIPGFILYQIISFVKAIGAKKGPIATKHLYRSKIEDIS